MAPCSCRCREPTDDCSPCACAAASSSCAVRVSREREYAHSTRVSGSTLRRPDGARSSPDRLLRSTSWTSEIVARAHRKALHSPLTLPLSFASQVGWAGLGWTADRYGTHVDSTRLGTDRALTKALGL